MNTDTATAAPVFVGPWVTIWEESIIRASIAHDKVHVVRRQLTSSNTQEGVANPNAKRTEHYRAKCGTTRRGRYLAVSEQSDVTCAKCARHA